MKLVKYFIISLIVLQIITCQQIDYENLIVWGLGLNPKVSLPVRYFFIQTVDQQSNNLTSSSGNIFTVKIHEKKTNNPVRVHIEVLDRHDGSYVVRYRLYDNYKNLEISIRNKSNHHINGSPYQLKGEIYDEKYHCPEEKLNKWYKKMMCNSSYTQIDLDILKFKDKFIDMDKLGPFIINKFNNRYSESICNYVILDNKIYKKCYGEYVGFSAFSDEVLISLARKVRLPDTEFILNLGDYPLNEKKQNMFLPIVSWCGSQEANDFVLPTYDITESSLEMMSRQSLDVLSIQASTGLKWSQKQNKSFWRGRDSRQERLDLVEISKNNPDLIDAALTHMFFFTEPYQIEKYGPTVNRTSFFDFFKFKYQLNIDGTVAAYRLPYLLTGDSLVFKQDSKYHEHFYADLKEYVHYIPVKRDLSDLIEKINWARENDDKAQQIVKNANNYAREFLLPHHIFCYHVIFLQEYSRRITSKIKVREGMQEIIDDSHKCNRHKSKTKYSKLDL